MRPFRKIKEVGFYNTAKGAIRSLYYRSLMKKYGFEECHLSTYELRKYLQAVAKYVSSHSPKNEVIDVGCGLGGLLRHIDAPNRTGIDMSANAIECAKFLDKTHKIEFKSGTYGAIGKDHTIDYLIALGFMHGSPETSWQEPFKIATSENDIKNIIVDVFKENPAEGSLHLDFTKVLPSEYHLIERMGPFLGEKYVEVYSKL